MSDDEGKRPRGRERFRSERNYDYLDNDGGRGGGGGGGGPGPVPYRRFGGGGDRFVWMETLSEWLVFVVGVFGVKGQGIRELIGWDVQRERKEEFFFGL